MFSSFRKLFGMRAETAGIGGQLVALAPALELPTRAVPRATRVEVPSRPAPAPAPATVKGGTMSIPLSAILGRLPAALTNRVRTLEVGEVEISISVQKVITQIAQGSVKISFGELRQASSQFFTPETDQDATLVEVPLHEVLSRLDPSLMPRRASQKQVAVPAEVVGPFGGQAQVAFSDGRVKPEAAKGATQAESLIAPSIPIAPMQPLPPQKPLSMPKAAAVPASIISPLATTSAAPIVAASVIAAKPAVTTKPVGEPSVKLASDATSFWSKEAMAISPKPAPVTVAAPVVPVIQAIAPTVIAEEEAVFKRVAPMVSVAPIAPVVELPRAATVTPLNPPAPVILAAPISPIAAVETPIIKLVEPEALPVNSIEATPEVPALNVVETRFITVSLSDVLKDWPEFICREITSLQIGNSSLSMPFGVIELAIRQGKVALPWRVVRSWIKPPLSIGNSPHDGTILELPLKVLTPIFMSEMRGAKLQRKVAVDASIPNLFSGGKANPVNPPLGNIPPVVVSASLQPASSAKLKPVETNYFAKKATEAVAEEAAPFVRKGATPGTDFLNRYATPNEIVSKAAALDGVDGALIALPDGLLVASNIPPTMNADTIAAFLPQIFGKVSQSTKELRLGELNNLNFTVGNIPWKIFKVGAIYFAAFGRADEPLPTGALAGIAAELDRKAVK